MTRLLGYVLSGATTTTAKFEPLEAVEDTIGEGMLVVIEEASSNGKRHILASITRIEVFNEFFEAGSVWSEAIRQNKLPPTKVARRYTLAELQLIGVITGNGLQSISSPPKPGSKVYEASPRHLAAIYGYVPDQQPQPPNVIRIGSLYGYASTVPAILDIEKITMHLAALGVTGSGKSNTMGVIIEELGNCEEVRIGNFVGKTIPVLVFDANGDYIDYYMRPDIVPSYRVVRLVFSKALPTVTRVPDADLQPIILDLNVFSSCLAELVEAIYALTRGGVLEGLELQMDLLTRALTKAMDDNNAKRVCPNYSGGVDFNCLFASEDGFNVLEHIVESEAQASGAHKSTVAAVKRALNSFRDHIVRHQLIGSRASSATITSDFVDEVTNPYNPYMVIVDFSPDGAPGIGLRIKQFVVYYFMKLLFDKFVDYKMSGNNRVMLVIVEEAQNYVPNQKEYPIGFSVAKGILALIATQGRKFGLSLALVTQRPSFVDPVIMSMMNTFIIHRISAGDVKFVQLVTGGLPKHIVFKLPTLETGIAILVGQMNKFPQPILVKVRKRKVHHAGGI